MSCIAIIPAKGFSSRCPGKNIRDFHGKPMIVHSIDAAQISGVFNRIVVSTDDPRVAEIADKAGAHVLLRPLGWDGLGTQELAARVLEGIDPLPEAACVIYPAAPLIFEEDLVEANAILADRCGVNFVFAVGAEPLRDAGAFYFGLVPAFLDREPLISPYTVMFPLPENRVCDINTETDMAEARAMYAALHA